jgi:hypothetical protein
VGGDTSITLADRWLGDTALDGDTYTYFEDEYALESDFYRLVDVRRFSTVFNIPVISRKEFYQRFPLNTTTGTPQIATIIDLAFGSTSARQQRVVFHPAPSTVMNIPYRYITSNLAVSTTGTAGAQMSSDDDEPIIPLRYRHVLVFYAIAQWYRDRKDDARSQEAGAEYVDLVRRMAGDYAPEEDRPRFVPKRAFRGPRIATSRRYSTGDEFEQMRD